jgi:hypothetical protein
MPKPQKTKLGIERQTAAGQPRAIECFRLHEESRRHLLAALLFGERRSPKNQPFKPWSQTIHQAI